MNLSQLLQIAPRASVEFLAESQLQLQSDTTPIAGIYFDHRKVVAGSVFVAVKGGQNDGHRFLKDAVQAGANVLVVEADDGARAHDLLRRKLDVEQLDPRIVYGFAKSTRTALADISAAFFGYPSRELFTVAVTGTNGKTTSTHMIEHVLKSLGRPTGVVGTIDHHLGEKIWPTSMTTPDPVEFQGRLREFVSLGAKAVALEASSHALDQCRLDAVDFDFAAFTNLTRDHLEYHQAMDAYFHAKYRLFGNLLLHSSKAKRTALFHVDDSWCLKAYDALKDDLKSKSASLEVLGFGRSAASDLRYEVLDQGFWGVCFKLTDSSGSREVRIQMPGIHNVQNAIVAYAAGVAAGCQPDDVIRVLAELKGVAGRLERVANTRQLNVFVDNAHTDDALRSILGMLDGIRREMRTHAETAETHTKIITVFGCGGDRDRGKRPLMMRAALDGSDEVILTSDNPRTEDPERILDDAMAAVSTAEHVKVRRYVDRRTAIGKAIELARPGDVVLIAGKGHETTQTIGTVKHPFSDANVAREIMEGKV